MAAFFFLQDLPRENCQQLDHELPDQRISHEARPRTTNFSHPGKLYGAA
jgi:hypothetical protein